MIEAARRDKNDVLQCAMVVNWHAQWRDVSIARKFKPANQLLETLWRHWFTRGRSALGSFNFNSTITSQTRIEWSHVWGTVAHEDLLTIVKRRKLQWCGHVSSSSGPAKTILQGILKGGRRRGRQRKRWEDNIREWTGPEFGKSQRAVENREKWRKLVAKSSVVPQRPSRLRGWW